MLGLVGLLCIIIDLLTINKHIKYLITNLKYFRQRFLLKFYPHIYEQQLLVQEILEREQVRAKELAEESSEPDEIQLGEDAAGVLCDTATKESTTIEVIHKRMKCPYCGEWNPDATEKSINKDVYINDRSEVRNQEDVAVISHAKEDNENRVQRKTLNNSICEMDKENEIIKAPVPMPRKKKLLKKTNQCKSKDEEEIKNNSNAQENVSSHKVIVNDNITNIDDVIKNSELINKQVGAVIDVNAHTSNECREKYETETEKKSDLLHYRYNLANSGSIISDFSSIFNNVECDSLYDEITEVGEISESKHVRHRHSGNVLRDKVSYHEFWKKVNRYGVKTGHWLRSFRKHNQECFSLFKHTAFNQIRRKIQKQRWREKINIDTSSESDYVSISESEHENKLFGNYGQVALDYTENWISNDSRFDLLGVDDSNIIDLDASKTNIPLRSKSVKHEVGINPPIPPPRRFSAIVNPKTQQLERIIPIEEDYIGETFALRNEFYGTSLLPDALLDLDIEGNQMNLHLKNGSIIVKDDYVDLSDLEITHGDESTVQHKLSTNVQEHIYTLVNSSSSVYHKDTLTDLQFKNSNKQYKACKTTDTNILFEENNLKGSGNIEPESQHKEQCTDKTDYEEQLTKEPKYDEWDTNYIQEVLRDNIAIDFSMPNTTEHSNELSDITNKPASLKSDASSSVCDNSDLDYFASHDIIDLDSIERTANPKRHSLASISSSDYISLSHDDRDKINIFASVQNESDSRSSNSCHIYEGLCFVKSGEDSTSSVSINEARKARNRKSKPAFLPKYRLFELDSTYMKILHRYDKHRLSSMN